MNSIVYTYGGVATTLPTYKVAAKDSGKSVHSGHTHVTVILASQTVASTVIFFKPQSQVSCFLCSIVISAHLSINGGKD